MSEHSRIPWRAALAAVTVTAVAATATLGASPSTAAPRPASINAGPQDLTQPSVGDGQGSVRLAERATGRQAYLLTLSTTGTTAAFARAGGKGATAKEAARDQLDRVETAQERVIAQLPSDADVLYRTHAALPAVGVMTGASPEALDALTGVSAVHPVAPKTRANASAVQLQGAPAAWVAHSETGEGTTVAIIDTGIDYTHANFGGPGTVAAYETELALSDTATDTSALFPTAKVVGGYDFVGNAYDAEDDATDTPQPDPNPLDCNGHGSHVGGSAAGFGENADGSTYTGAYDASTPFDSMKIGPGMAPDATLIALKVFGCEGSTNVVAEAIDRAVDPNGDGDPSDHVDVANMSLGSGYGSPDDGDAVMADAAAQAGVVMAISAGNSGDVQDVGGSPGSSVRSITVANSVDATSVIDGVSVTIDGGAAQTFGQTRSVAYDWTTKPDLSGQVVELPGPDDTACSALTPSQSAAVTGKVAIVRWTQAALECGSVTRSRNLREAGATGFIFHNSEETFSAGITGDAIIPGVLVVKSGGDAIRAALQGAQPVTVTGTSYGTVIQDFPENTDTVNDSSSRGGHAAGALKPDVSAVGTSVYSTGVGTGTRGEDLSGTSMAAPMVAGLAALVKGANPTWTTEMVKADIMNTAGQDLFLGANHTGATYAPNRVGAGRIQAEAALDNEVLAYVGDDSGAVSVSFGSVEVSGPTSLTKTVTVQNTGAGSATYDTSYVAATSVPGTSYTVTPSSVTVPAGGEATVQVTFEALGRGSLTKTADATTGRNGIVQPYPREVLSSASGRVVLTPQSGIALRVPVYAAPRPASEMSQASELAMPAGAQQSAQLTLDGFDLGNGANGTGDSDPLNDIYSIAAGFELTAVDGKEPTCTATLTAGCITLPEDRFADVAHVGVTSDYPLHEDQADSMAYFAINAHGPWSTPASKIEYDLYLDVDGDKEPDLVAYTTRLTGEDIFVVNLVDLATGESVDLQLLNNRFGDVDTAAFDSDTMILPVWLDALAAYGVDPSHPRVNYGIISYSAYSADYVDAVGLDPATGKVSMSADLFTPGISVTDADGDGPLVLDQGDAELTVTRNAASYAADGGTGLMVVHLHNKVGEKTQVVTLEDPVLTPTTTPTATPTTTPTTTPTVTPTPTPSPLASTTVAKVKPKKPRFTQDFKVVVKVAADGTTPTGRVVVRIDGRKVGARRLDDGRVVVKVTRNLTVGRHKLVALYKGSDTVTRSRDRLRFRVVR